MVGRRPENLQSGGEKSDGRHRPHRLRQRERRRWTGKVTPPGKADHHQTSPSSVGDEEFVSCVGPAELRNSNTVSDTRYEDPGDDAHQRGIGL